MAYKPGVHGRYVPFRVSEKQLNQIDELAARLSENRSATLRAILRAGLIALDQK